MPLILGMSGAFYTKEGCKTLKHYGLIFKCLASHAIHLKTLNSMESDSFISTTCHFINRQGKVCELHSDQDTNFVCARNELSVALQEQHRVSVKSFPWSKDCNWIDFCMNLPTASHMGGIWERMMKSFRSVLSTLLQKQGTQLDDEGLRTLMSEAENVMNSRPLTKDNLFDPFSPEPITPNHLLTQKTEIVLPPLGNFQTVRFVFM